MRWSIVCVLAIGGGALARPATAPTWADWVGDWEGKLKWTSCTSDGEPNATIALDATDGAMAIDLSSGGAGLGSLSLLEDNGRWLGQQADVTVHAMRPHPDVLELAVELDSGCQVHGTLHRSSVGIASCDRLDAWARIESRCSKLTKPPLENAARLARQHAQWAKSKGDDRTELAAQCEARATKVEAELVDAGCAPNPDPTIGMRGAECQAAKQVASRIARCTNLQPDVRVLLSRDAYDLAAAAQTADAAALPVIENQCRQVRERLLAAAKNVGCPP